MRQFVIKHSSYITLAVACTACGAASSSSSTGHRDGKATRSASDSPGDAAHNLLKNRDFESGSMLPWLTSFSPPAEGEGLVKKGALCVNVKQGGHNRWDAQVRHREMVIQKGHDYIVSFKAWSSRPTKVAGKVGMSGPPYLDYWAKQLELSETPKEFAYKFKMTHPDDPTAELALHFGGHMISGTEPVELCFDDFILSDPEFAPPPPTPRLALPPIRVNQVGYIPSFPKFAVLISEQKEPLSFELLDAQGKSAFQGKTAPRGVDADSGDSVHAIDFSSFTGTGKGFRLRVGKDESDKFDIDARIYAKVKYDAFKYFYLNRSGVELKMPYAGDAKWTRPAGHPKDVAPCSAAASCDYTLDVSHGWYDAGDYGKYVVNGGVSVWTLMNWYERTTALSGDSKSFGDRKDLIPESGNKIPDVLDEAKWEMDFLLAMQVPPGKPLAGMVHHKMHDVDWTALGIGPHESQMKRELRPVSTAATLNLAAAAAQAARLFKAFDPAFSERCLKAAETAYAAAQAEPKRFASATDSKGGGPYDDDHLSDEFYWAAAELWLTTGKANYRSDVEKSPLDASIEGGGVGGASILGWQRVDALGKISMALAAPKSHAKERDGYRAQLEKVADQYVELTRKSGYHLPFAADKSGQYPWGSNSNVANNAMVLALAFDFTKAPQYKDAVTLSLDYLFGRNPMAQSYVTGYGTRPLMNPHHRFWAHQASAKYPPPPPGVLSGGPNSGLQDPYVKAAGLTGCKPAKCFVDHSEAWSANEVTINWNAPLMWDLAWTDEQAK